jgi:hypothetical protein
LLIYETGGSTPEVQRMIHKETILCIFPLPRIVFMK